MKFLFCPILLLISGCAQMMPGLFQAVDDIATNESVSVSVDKAAIQKDKDIQINVNITNK